MRTLIEKIKGNKQILKFGTIGVLNTLVDMGTFALLDFIGIYYMIAQTIAYSFGVINSYVFNKNWTFEDTGKEDPTKFVKFIAVNLLTLAVSLLLMNLFVGYVHLGKMVSKILTTGVIQFLNFFGYKFLVFRIIKKD